MNAHDTSAGRARIGIVGAGWWSTYTHIPALLAHPQAMLTGLCDTDPARLQAAAEAYGVAQTYTSLEAMLDEARLDGVIVATPHATHAALAQTCLERGLHVLLEKPMTLYAAQARALVSLAEARGRELIIGYPYHYTAMARRARQVIQTGRLGPVQYVSCSLTSSVAALLRGDESSAFKENVYPVHGPGKVYSEPELSGGGQGHLQITHSAGLMFFVTGLRAQRVLALMVNHGLPLDLVDVMAVAFEDGALGAVGGSGNSATHRLDLVVRCQQGGLDLDVAAQTLTVHIAEGSPVVHGPEGGEAYPRFATAHNLVDVVLGTAANGSPAEVGWRTVELLDAAYRSAERQGQAVWVKDLYSAEADA
jgi:predicted dehydrogenase